MRKEPEKPDKQALPNGKKPIKNIGAGDKKSVPRVPVGNSISARSKSPAERKPVSEIKVTIRKSPPNGKNAADGVAKRKIQVSLFQNQTADEKKSIPVPEKQVGKSNDFESAIAGQKPGTPMDDQPGKISSMLQKISAMSHTLHEENQHYAGDQRKKAVDAAEAGVSKQRDPGSDAAKQPAGASGAAAPVFGKQPVPGSAQKEPDAVIPEKVEQAFGGMGLSVKNTEKQNLAELPKIQKSITPAVPEAGPETPTAPSSPSPGQTNPLPERQQPHQDRHPNHRPEVTVSQSTVNREARPLSSKTSPAASAPVQPILAETKQKITPSATVGSPPTVPLQKTGNRRVMPEKKRRHPVWLIGSVVLLGMLVGAGLGGWFTYRWYDANNAYKKEIVALKAQLALAKDEEQKLILQLDESYIRLNNVQAGLNQMNKLFVDINVVPDKPRYQKTKQGLIIFWVDGMSWRRYHLYQARGKNGKFKKINKRSTKKTHLYMRDLKPGLWRYALTALDREGQETEMSDVLDIEVAP